MPADYPLELLGPENFQRLCQGLLLEDFPGLQALPVAQADGGRDAFAWIMGGGRRETVVFQVKFHHKPLSVPDPHKWLVDQLRDEVPKIAALAEGARASHYYLLTNVPGTAPLEKGSIDRAQAILDDNVPVPAQVWWRDEVVRRLDRLPALHWAFPDLLTGADVLKNVVERLLTEHAGRRAAAIRAFLSRELEDDEQVRFQKSSLSRSFSTSSSTCRPWCDPRHAVSANARATRSRCRTWRGVMSCATNLGLVLYLTLRCPRNFALTDPSKS